MPSPSFTTDPVALAQDLIRCQSVTPADDGAQALLASVLEGMGFEVVHLPFGPADAPTPNFYAKIGTGRPSLCFAGHTDVVPPVKGGHTIPLQRKFRMVDCMAAGLRT